MGLNFLSSAQDDPVEVHVRLIPKNWDMDEEEPEINDPVELEVQRV